MELSNKWREKLNLEFEKDYYKELEKFLEKEYKNELIYPTKENLYSAFILTDFDDVKVVILGQDPYHGPNQAHGLSFSVLPGNKVPPSLANMYKELASDLGIQPVKHGYLKSWAEQGVLLLNTVLTVRDGQPNSHKGKGWEQFTDKAIEVLNEREEPIIFILWGKPAQSKTALITNDQHHIIEAPHPSPLAAYRGFFGSKPYSKTNQLLKEMGQSEINWELPEIV
ncbi:uracil-DNA glycosylase [Vagococcus coleopterorum]|uniref:Uracil-DNA glycosylase n=1 Tax=Vagococcus coleopterorum TaxID=2714946 RepID=A0A6G8ALT1_9ENTE|nr:uracil-DNA glycosylase [Vagococcus coleopterorum]QIL46031.1 uracil-DNA glycosylase [Vagococcus coleopterorum]